MKSLAIFLLICVLFSFISTETSIVSSLTEAPCQSPCLACQQAVYNLKFHRKANCMNNYCRSTCHKVAADWSKPGSPFVGFQNDAEGKCDICFRAGYCQMSECMVQKNYEKAVINQVVDSATLNGIVDKKAMNKMVKKILENKQVNFKKIARTVQSQIKNVKRHIKLDMVHKLAKAVKKAVKAGRKTTPDLLPPKVGKLIKLAMKESKLIEMQISKLLKEYKKLVEDSITEKISSKKKKLLKAVRVQKEKIKKVIGKAIYQLEKHVFKLEEAKGKRILEGEISEKKKKTKKMHANSALAKTIDGVIAILKKVIAKAQAAKKSLS